MENALIDVDGIDDASVNRDGGTAAVEKAFDTGGLVDRAEYAGSEAELAG